MRLPTPVSFAASIAVLAPLAILAPAVSAQEQLWITQFGTSEGDFIGDMARADSGGVYMVGTTTVSFGGPSAGNEDIYVFHYNDEGNQTWSHQFGTSARDYGKAIAPDGAGGFFVAGATDGNLGGPNAGPSGTPDAYLARFDSAGSQLWIRQFGTDRSDWANAVLPDGAGGVFVAGSTSGDLAGQNANWGSADVFVARYDSAGNQLWILQIGSVGSESGDYLAPDATGGVIVAGRTDGNLGGPHAGVGDIFLAGYNSAGNQIWINHFGTSSNDVLNDMAPDGAGGVYMGGETNGSLGGPNAGFGDAFLTRYDSEGNQTWLRQFGTSRGDGAQALQPHVNGGVTVAGHTWGSLGAPNAGASDAFLAHYDDAGTLFWIRQFGTSKTDRALHLASDGGGGAMVAGTTGGSLSGPNAGRSDIFLARYSIDSCYADCDQSGALDIFDFLCFQNSFVLGEPYACDCDPDPICDIFDFLCFQNAFVGGCP